MLNDFTILPSDPAILLSYVNMKLRDNYNSLTELCEDMHFTIDEFINHMKSKGWDYNESSCKFW